MGLERRVGEGVLDGDFFTYTASYTPRRTRRSTSSSSTRARRSSMTYRSGDRYPPSEHIPNGGVRDGHGPMAHSGHSRGEPARRRRDAHGGSACLELIASGEGDDGINKLETDTSPAMSGGHVQALLLGEVDPGQRQAPHESRQPHGRGTLPRDQLALPDGPGSRASRTAPGRRFRAGTSDPSWRAASPSPAVPGAGKPRDGPGCARATRTASHPSRPATQGGHRGWGVRRPIPLLDDGPTRTGRRLDGLFAGRHARPSAWGTR